MKRFIAAVLIVVISMFIVTPTANAGGGYSWYWYKVQQQQARQRAYLRFNPVYRNPNIYSIRQDGSLRRDYIPPGHYAYMMYWR